jgi:hypothetical protein
MISAVATADAGISGMRERLEGLIGLLKRQSRAQKGG